MFKRNIDKKLSSAMTKEKYCLPTSYQERVKQTLENLPERPLKRRTVNWRYPRRAVTLAALCAVLAITSISANSILEEYLNQMDSEDRQKYVDTVKTQEEIQVDSYTRELTDAEREKMNELYSTYMKGTFPEEVIPICETMEEAELISYCFIVENSTFKLPETELTDEQLLQMIDFRQKREYSLKKANEEQDLSTEEPVNICVTEQEAVESARELIEGFYQVDTSDYEVISGMYGQYYNFMFQKENDIYCTLVKPENGQAIYVDLNISEDRVFKDCLLDEEFLAEVYEITRNTLEEYLLPESKIIRSCYTYSLKDDTLYNGVAEYIFEDSDNTCYYLSYSFNTNRIYSLEVLSDYNVHAKHFENGEKVNGMNNETFSRVTINVEEK